MSCFADFDVLSAEKFNGTQYSNLAHVGFENLSKPCDFVQFVVFVEN